MQSFFDIPTDPDELKAFLKLIERIDAEKEAHYSAIGRVAASWANLEHDIDNQIERLGSVPLMSAACLTANILGINKILAYSALAKFVCPAGQSLSALKKLAEDVRALGETRNRIVHDPWLLISPKEKAMRLEKTARGTLRAELVPMPTDSVLKVNEEIGKLHGRFIKLANQLFSERDATLLGISG